MQPESLITVSAYWSQREAITVKGKAAVLFKKHVSGVFQDDFHALAVIRTQHTNGGF